MTNRKSIIELIAARLNIRNVIIGLDSPALSRQFQQDIEPAKSVIHEVKKKNPGDRNDPRDLFYLWKSNHM